MNLRIIWMITEQKLDMNTTRGQWPIRLILIVLLPIEIATIIILAGPSHDDRLNIHFVFTEFPGRV